MKRKACMKSAHYFTSNIKSRDALKHPTSKMILSIRLMCSQETVTPWCFTGEAFWEVLQNRIHEYNVFKKIRLPFANYPSGTEAVTRRCCSTLLTKRLQQKCFPMNFKKLLRTLLSRNTLERLLLLVRYQRRIQD